MTDTEKGRGRDRQREKQAPCREPDMGLNSGSPGSYPGLKAAPNHWAIGAAQILNCPIGTYGVLRLKTTLTIQIQWRLFWSDGV